MLTPTDLLAAGYRFHPPQGVDGPLYQKLFRGPAHEILYFVNITDIISDWNYSADDPDGFNAAMDRIVMEQNF